MKKLYRMLVSSILASTIILTTSCGASAGSSASAPKTRLEKILADGTLTIATSPDYPPFEFEDATKTGQDKYVGADMELARYIAKELGVELKIEAMDFDACLAAITTGTVDLCIAGLTPDDERKKTIDFSDIYSDEGDRVIIIRAEDADKYKTIQDLADAKIACLNGSSQESVVEEYLSADNMELVSSFNNGILMLRTKKVEGVAMSTVSASNYIANSDEFVMMDESFPYNEDLGLAVGIVKGEDDLTAKVNEIIGKVSEEGLYTSWVEQSYELSNSISEN